MDNVKCTFYPLFVKCCHIVIWTVKGTGTSSTADTTVLYIVQVASKTTDGFWNLKTSVLAMRLLHSDCHHSQWCLEFCWEGALVSATPHCRSWNVTVNRVRYSYTAWFPSAVSNSWCTLPQYCYCGYRNGIKKDQWRTVNHKDIHFQLVHHFTVSRE
jgi:hypothetical protein